MITMVPQLHVGDVVGNRLLTFSHLHDLAGRNEEELWVAINEPGNQPWTRNAVYARLFSGHPFHRVLLSLTPRWCHVIRSLRLPSHGVATQASGQPLSFTSEPRPVARAFS